jgi:hypothetical protein
MKKLSLVLALMFLTAFPAFAQNIGLGWEDGVSLKFPVQQVTVQGVLNFTNTSSDAKGAADGTSFGLAGYVAYPWINIDKSKLNLFGGIGIASSPKRDTDFGLKFGLEPEVMVTDHIGVSGKLGLQFMSIGGVQDVDNSGGSLFGFFGTASVHWYFGK